MFTVPFARTLNPGDTGPDVVAVKRALVKWNLGKPQGVDTTSAVMGGAAVALLKLFQHAEHLTADGVYGPATHAKLTPFFDLYGASLMAKEAEALAPRNLFLRIADLTVTHKSLFRYTEAGGDGPGTRGWFSAAPLDTTGVNWAAVVAQHGSLTTDCSKHFMGIGHHAGIKHPLFDGRDGFTGTILDMLDHIDLADAKPGDGCVFVGPRVPQGAHVTILRTKLANDWGVVNMGGSPDPSDSFLSVQAAWEAANMGAPTKVIVRLPA